MTKAFWKSKRFYGCVSTLVLIVGDMAASGVSMGNLAAFVTTAFALYGGIVAQAPLGMSDQAAPAIAPMGSVDAAKNPYRR